MAAPDIVERLGDAQRRWLEINRRRRELSDERLRLIWEARDDFGMSYRQIGRALGIDRTHVIHLLGCGYPGEPA
jgi:hypothetical protein